MRGSQPLLEEELKQIVQELEESTDRFSKRNLCLILLGCYCGFRVSEILSLVVADCCHEQDLPSIIINKRITVKRRNMKNKMEGRTVMVNPKLQKALYNYLSQWPEIFGKCRCESMRQPLGSSPLFPSQKYDKDENGNDIPRSLTQRQVDMVLNKLCKKLGIETSGTHLMRKTFADRVNKKLDRNIALVQKALGHKSINSTTSYLSFDQTEIDNAISKI